MEYRKELEDIVQRTIQELFTEAESQVTIERPRDPSHGDFSTNVAMQLAGKLKRNPLETAEEIKSTIESDNSEIISSIEIARPGFINFRLKEDLLDMVIVDVLEHKESFGEGDILADQKILIEHTSPNPTKEFHLGHLMTHMIGVSMTNLFEFQGAEVVQDCIDNNRGIAIARLMWGYLNFAKKNENAPTDIAYWAEHKDEWKTPVSENIDPGKFVDELYTKASVAFKENPEVEEMVRQMVVDWENEDPLQWELWKLTQQWVWDGFEQVLKRVGGWQFDKIWHEHEIYKKGKEHVLRGVKEGFFKKLEDGAILTDLKKDFDIPDTILIKRDGTSLYITQDLELTNKKRKTFNPDQMIWVIGPEQSLAMKQMFAASSQLGFGKYEDFHHLPYGFILVNKDGKAQKMSSRDGTSLSVNDLIDKAKSRLIEMIQNDSISDNEKDSVAETIAIGAIKYSLLRVTRTQDRVFDFDTTISLDGDSGPYLIYTYTRAQSILRKAEEQGSGLNTADLDASRLQLTEEVEKLIVKKLSEFPEVTKKAAEDYAPHLVCNYVFELATLYNQFYNSVPVLIETDEQKLQSRLALSAATAQVIHNSLGLLGIEVVERM